jgi:SnoaL-like domain
MLTREHVLSVIGVYIKAWESQNPDLIVTIFTPAASYHERVLREPIPDREAIRRYWQTKVVQEQANIRCRLLSLYLDERLGTAIAEWDASFDDLAEGVRKRMREIAVLTFEDGLISSLREYWSSEVIGELSATAADHRAG